VTKSDPLLLRLNVKHNRSKTSVQSSNQGTFAYRYRDPWAGNVTVHYIESTEFAFDHHYVTVYPWVVDGLLASMAPFVALLVLNASLVREVRRSTRYLQRNSAASATIQREELQISVMLISIVVVFFVCQVMICYLLIHLNTKVSLFIFGGFNSKLCLVRAVNSE
jgi:hypothetical protein